MAKKRKTRKEKSQVKHQFSPWARANQPVQKNEKGEVVETTKPEQELPAYIYTDLKRITLIMGAFIVGVIILAVLANFTDIFNPFFNIFHIKY